MVHIRPTIITSFSFIAHINFSDSYANIIPIIEHKLSSQLVIELEAVLNGMGT